MKKIARLLTVLAATLIAGCATTPPPPSSVRSEAVHAFVAAFNAQDVERMMGMVSGDVQWVSLGGSALHVETKGKDALRSSMAAYFAKCASCRARLTDMTDTGTRISVHELAGSKTSPERRSLAIYEFDGALIKRVYYFPPEPKGKGN